MRMQQDYSGFERVFRVYIRSMHNFPDFSPEVRMHSGGRFGVMQQHRLLNPFFRPRFKDVVFNRHYSYWLSASRAHSARHTPIAKGVSITKGRYSPAEEDVSR